VAQERARDFLKRFDLEDRGDLYPSQLSGGQRQRVAIAQQFLCSEHILLMDEPFSGLDLVAVEKVSRMITEVANSDELNTIIVVTHDIDAACAVADTIWLLGRDRDDHGHIIPGAKVKATYNLIERGLMWREGLMGSKEFADLVREIRTIFPSL
jgi:polar amino acid transport system ATP-binding protein/sulfate transport system ATP-binding protein